MSDEVQLSVSLPLDGDGFLRRACPTCEREFKWVSSEAAEVESSPVSEGGYYCPYCAIQAPENAWWTVAQLEIVDSVATQDIVGPEFKKFERSLRDISRQSGGFVSASLKTDIPPEADPLVETDDMRRVDFECHPTKPVKVLDDWARAVHCLICGTAASATPAG